MYRVDRNNFYKNTKSSTVYTPSSISNFVFGILDGKISKEKLVVDPCVGTGSLLIPFDSSGYRTLGVDVVYQGYDDTLVKDFMLVRKGEIESPSVVIANPPFNVDPTIRAISHGMGLGRRPLLPELWLYKIVELWGKGTPIVLFSPYGMRLNQTQVSRRWKMFVDGNYPRISSIISLPKDAFPNVLFHSEILIFNVPNILPHYFLNEESCQ